MTPNHAVNERLLAVIEKAISDVVCSRDDLGRTHFVEIRDAVFAALRAVPSPDTVGVREALETAKVVCSNIAADVLQYPSREDAAAKIKTIFDGLLITLSPSHCAAGRREEITQSLARFVMWAMLEGSWQGDDIDGGAAQDKAEALGLIVQVQYDPAKHGESAHCEPGDSWFVPSDALQAALTSEQSGPTAGMEET